MNMRSHMPLIYHSMRTCQRFGSCRTKLCLDDAVSKVTTGRWACQTQNLEGFHNAAFPFLFQKLFLDFMDLLGYIF